MDSPTVNGLKLRRPFSESRRNNIWRFLSSYFSINSAPVTNTYSVKQENWILDEPTNLALDNRGTTNTIFKEYIMKYFLIDKGRSFPGTVLEAPFHKLMLKDNNPTLLVLGPNLYKEQAFYSCDIEETGKELLNIKYEIGTLELNGFLHCIHERVNVRYEGYSYKGSYKISENPMKPNRLLYLPPSQYSNIPLLAFFYRFSQEDAIIYRDLLVVYRIRAIRRGYEPIIDNVLSVFFDPPYEIYVISSPHGDDSKQEYIDVDRCEDVTEEERQAYQAYFMLKMKFMLGDKLKYSIFCELLENTNHAYSESVYLEESDHFESGV
ncbi:uncharacterized protein NDAI_0G00110 [Naumovozyma dairenensis CBS 421]|uniref:Uncharacterized protein n=1 Tax=Naumovozyma dairenensis (strain ATCC 10597 / BCRC 20456 / CBS 421 / NBRC 0211 / NRRL Y-12639) TaxID=1071378 RepID=G0WDC6_NAUDC|nr:hypothetical protein NDAI_0G00110 [Naumovozyma dairenensis CBS 421]CCD25787.2 hypothetical protein NDAI_0G00110 [Naumovozyma dairenensis CBS 421]